MRIFSIHKSKGLEYDHVIVPFCDWTLEKQYGNILWCKPTEEPFNELPIVPIDYSQKQMMGTIYESDYLQEHLQNTVDNLNLLYVAFTRACRSLTVIGRRKASGTRSLIIEQAIPLVANALSSMSSSHHDVLLEGLEDEGSPLCFTYGQLTLQDAASVENNSQSSENPFLQPYIPLEVDIRTYAHRVSFRQSNRSKAFMSDDDEEARQHEEYIQTGSVLHEVFSTIHTADDIGEALRRLQSEGVIYDGKLTPERIADMLQKRLKDPRVADWFSNRWRLYNECSILSINHSASNCLQDKDGEVCQHRPDRVMTDGHRWIVVDFKFGTPKSEYHDQVRQYMSLLADMGHQNISGYLWYVYSNRIEEVTLHPDSNHL